MTTFTKGESEDFERLMKTVPNFDKRPVIPKEANGNCYRCEQFNREKHRCRFSFCLFDDTDKR